MNRWRQNQRSRLRERLLMDNIHFRQNLRMVNQNEREMGKLHDQFAAQAVEAEKSGNHAMAVHLASEAAKLKKYRMVSSNVKNSLEVAHTVQSTNRAMAGILAASKEAVGSLAAGNAAANAYAMQTDLAVMQDQVQAFMEQSGMLFDNMAAQDESAGNEEGEKALEALLSSSRKDKQLRLLQDTNRRLERLPRNHRMENERSKE